MYIMGSTMSYIIELLKYIGICTIFLLAFEVSNRHKKDKSVIFGTVIAVFILTSLCIFGYDLHHKWEYIIKTCIFVGVPLTIGIFYGLGFGKDL